MSLNPEGASIFKINCPYNSGMTFWQYQHITSIYEGCEVNSETYIVVFTETSEKHPPNLSHGEIVAIVVSLALLVLVVILGVCFGIRNCRNYKKLDENIPIGQFASISSCGI